MPITEEHKEDRSPTVYVNAYCLWAALAVLLLAWMTVASFADHARKVLI